MFEEISSKSVSCRLLLGPVLDHGERYLLMMLASDDESIDPGQYLQIPLSRVSDVMESIQSAEAKIRKMSELDWRKVPEAADLYESYGR